MDTQQQNASSAADKPSFFGMPRGARFWAKVGPRFWTGALFGFLNGIGFGLITGAAMVQEWGLITTKNDTMLAGIAIILLWISLFFAQWRIGRIERREQKNS